MHYTRASNHMFFLSVWAEHKHVYSQSSYELFPKDRGGGGFGAAFFPFLLQRKDDAVEFMRSAHRQSFFICYLLFVFREFASRHR